MIGPASAGRGGPDLPDFPWDALAGHKATAGAHLGGIVDLSVGTPVDPVAPVISAALSSVADVPGYPLTHGTPALREAVLGALERRHGLTGLDSDAVLPTLGSKELVAWLPTLLGVRPGEIVAIPELAYPTYEVGARLAGADVVRLRDGELPPAGTALLWVNSPSNPTGRVLDTPALAALVEGARAVGAFIASDECYLDLPWTARPVSVLDAAVHGGRLADIVAAHSFSKTSSLAGYRAGFVTGDPVLVKRLLEVRRHAGMIMPRPVQAAMTAALNDDDHVVAQRDRYAGRRKVLLDALHATGFRVEHSEAGLYLWATRGEDAWATVTWFAERGILVAPGAFYGPSGGQHVRVALTATDERVHTAADRLAG